MVSITYYFCTIHVWPAYLGGMMECPHHSSMVTRAQTAVTQGNIGHTSCCSGHRDFFLFIFGPPADARVGEVGLKSLLLTFPVPLLQLLVATESLPPLLLSSYVF